jgi:hypothetical protein
MYRAIVFLLCLAAAAQDSTVAGRVVDSTTGDPIKACVKSIRQAGQEMSDRTADLRNGPASDLTIVMSLSGAQVSGTVSDAKGPVANGFVFVFAPGAARIAASAQSAADGSYVIHAVPPGKYKIAAADPREFRGRGPASYENQAISIELSEHAAATQDLRIVRE